MTLMMRPSVPSPTGTAIGWPVSVTSWPRTSPSLVSMAMVRTVDSPRCCATSSTRRWPWFLVSSALRIAGRCPWNCTSTTGPMTWLMCPPGLAMDRPCYSRMYRCAASHRLGAGNDLDQLLGDHRLAGAVVGQRLLADHFAGVAGGIVHRSHLRAVERRRVPQERAEDLHRDGARQKLREDLGLLGLVFVDRAVVVAGLVRKHRRDDLLRGRDLRDDRPETREEQGADVERALLVEPHDLVADPFGILEGERADRAQLDVLDDLLLVEAAQLLVALAADAEELDLLALGHQRVGALACEPHDRRVERAAQAALGGADQEQMHAVAAGAGEQPRGRAEVADRGGDVAEHLPHALGIGPRGFRRRRRPAQLGGRHHLHRLGDLLRRLGGGDAHAHVLEAGHGLSACSARNASCRVASHHPSRHANVFAYSSTAALSLAAVASSRSLLSRMAVRMPCCWVRISPKSPSSKARTRSTGSGSR